jgi:lysophosphatidate acyltransferase
VGVFLFPEGTRSHAEEPGMLPFKKGAFHMAVKAQVPIIPIVFGNYSQIYSSSNFRLREGVIPIRGTLTHLRDYQSVPRL